MTKRKRGSSSGALNDVEDVAVGVTASSMEIDGMALDGGVDDDENRVMAVVPLDSPAENKSVLPEGDAAPSLTVADDAESGTSGCQRATTSGLILRSSVRTQKRRIAATAAVMTVTSNPSSKRVIRVRTVKRVSAKVVKKKTKMKGKTCRSWEVWSVEAKKAFFEALCEYGKDFESIQTYVVQKTHKKGCPVQVIKNKDQVRHFYYRTWHKISQHLDISDDVKKQTQELYGLINYGELRKKLRGPMDYRHGKKLNELVHQGATSIRCKGKMFRVKTPVCRALKRLVEIEDEKDGETRKLPESIEIEFRPRDNRAWTRVQSVAQNPRLRMKVRLQQRLSTVIDYLQRKWIEPALKQRRLLLDRVAAGAASKKVDLNEPFLRVRLIKDVTLCKVSLKETVEVTSSSVSLQNYRRKVRGTDESEASTASTSICKKVPKGKTRTSTENKKTVVEDTKQCREDVASPTTDHQSVNKKNSRRKLVVSDAASDPSRNHEDDEAKKSAELDSAHELTLRQLLALETAADSVSAETVDERLFSRKRSFLCDTMKESSDIAVNGAQESSTSTSENNSAAVQKLDTEAALASVRGWTVADCGALTVGGIYLLLDGPSKLVLEYEWEYPTSTPPPTDASKSSNVTKLTTILGRLLSIASSVVAEGGRHRSDRLLSGQSFGASCRCSHQPSCPLAAASNVSNHPIRNHPTTRGAMKISKPTNVPKVTVPVSCSVAASRVPTFPVELTTKAANSAQIATEIFRKPALIPAQNKTTVVPIKSISSTSVSADDKAFKEQLFKYRRTKGRSGNSMVVQRELLPKASPAHSVMTLSIIPSASQLAGSFMPVLTSRPAAITTLASVVPLSQSTGATKVLRLATTSVSPSSTLTLPIGTLTATGSSIPMPTTAPCTILISDDRVHRTGVTAAASSTLSSFLTTVSSRTSFTNRLVTTTSSSSSTSTIPTTLSGLTSFPLSRLNLQTGSIETNGEVSSSIPVISISESSTRSTLSISPPTISSLLDISLTGTDTSPLTEVNLGSDISSDKLLELNLGNSNTFSGLLDMTLLGKSAVGSNSDDGALTSNPTLGGGNAALYPRPVTPSNSPISSHFKISSPGLENNWFNGDTSDFSLSNLLSHLESPIKVSASLTSTGLHSSEAMDTMARLAPDMDSQLRSLISESSIDYIAKFEDLAAQIGKK